MPAAFFTRCVPLWLFFISLSCVSHSFFPDRVSLESTISVAIYRIRFHAPKFGMIVAPHPSRLAQWPHIPKVKLLVPLYPTLTRHHPLTDKIIVTTVLAAGPWYLMEMGQAQARLVVLVLQPFLTKISSPWFSVCNPHGWTNNAAIRHRLFLRPVLLIFVYRTPLKKLWHEKKVRICHHPRPRPACP